MKILTRAFLSIVSIPIFSRLYGRLTRIRHPRFLVRSIIGFFKDTYQIEMDDYQGNVEDYPSLLEFFIRPLDPQKRPLTPGENILVSPADGVLKEVETVYEDKATQVKGTHYAISDLLREDLDFSKGWHVLTIYLSPRDYHRYHYPINGKIEGYCHARGPLFPVNHLGVNLVKGLFARNERVITRFRTTPGELPSYAIAVGATFVGSIKMSFIDKIKRDNCWKPMDLTVTQLGEMGRFEMGSSILLVFPKELGEPRQELKGKKIKVGDPLLT